MHRRRLFLALSFCSVLLSCLPTVAQSGFNPSGSSNCTLADFDISVDFVNGPGDSYSVVLKQRNVSSHDCVLDGQIYGPSFSPDRAEGVPIELCYDCEHRLPNGMYPVRPAPTLEPGQVATRSYRWNTKPADQPCVQPKWMAGLVLVNAPSLLKKVCSKVDVSRLELETANDSHNEPESQIQFSRNGVDDNPSSPGLKISSSKSTFYQEEYFVLRVAPAGATGENVSDADSCPALYRRQRSPDGGIRIDEVQPVAFKGCRWKGLGHQVEDWTSGFDVDSGVRGGVGEYTLQLFQLTSSTEAGRLHFTSSNVLRVQVVDPAAIQRKWGLPVRGVAADITLDKDIYGLGENVPLHLAVENFSAEGAVYGGNPIWDPCSVLGVEVFDATGHRLSPSDKFPDTSVCMGHGRGPMQYEKGKLVPLERSLGSLGKLPNRPGTYTIVVTWSPVISPSSEPPKTLQQTDPNTTVTAQAVATIQIVSDPK